MKHPSGVTQEEYNEAIRQGRDAVAEGAMNMVSKANLASPLYTSIYNVRNNRPFEVSQFIGPESGNKFGSQVIMGDEWTEQHPWLSMGIDFVTDPELLIGLGVGGAQGIKYVRNTNGLHSDFGTHYGFHGNTWWDRIKGTW